MAFCSHCGNRLSNGATFCPACGVAVPVRVVSAPSDDAVLKMLLPVGRSGLSILAGYLGLLSLIPFVGILAIIIGVIALCGLKKNPRAIGKERAWFGITMGVVTTIAWIWFAVELRMC